MYTIAMRTRAVDTCTNSRARCFIIIILWYLKTSRLCALIYTEYTPLHLIIIIGSCRSLVSQSQVEPFVRKCSQSLMNFFAFISFTISAISFGCRTPSPKCAGDTEIPTKHLLPNNLPEKHHTILRCEKVGYPETHNTKYELRNTRSFCRARKLHVLCATRASTLYIDRSNEALQQTENQLGCAREVGVRKRIR